MPHTGCHGVAVATSLNYSVPQVPSPALPGSTESRKRRKRKKKKSPQTIKVILASSEQAKGLGPFGRTRAAHEPIIKTRIPSTVTGKGFRLLFGFPP